MTGMEFYFTPKGEVMIIDECGTRQLEQSNREFISEIITRMGIFWPAALEKASLEYTDRRSNIPWFEFSIVRSFLNVVLVSSIQQWILIRWETFTLRRSNVR